METKEEEVEFIESCAIMALSGIISRSGMFDDPSYIAKHAFDIAEAMNVERKKRQDENN